MVADSAKLIKTREENLGWRKSLGSKQKQVSNLHWGTMMMMMMMIMILLKSVFILHAMRP
jgi:hypothetical protein